MAFSVEPDFLEESGASRRCISPTAESFGVSAQIGSAVGCGVVRAIKKSTACCWGISPELIFTRLGKRMNRSGGVGFGALKLGKSPPHKRRKKKKKTTKSGVSRTPKAFPQHTHTHTHKFVV